jgi:uncharacterized protein (TIGR02246 family)
MTVELDLEEIDKVREAHIRSLNTDDAATWAKLFTEDGVQMPPNASPNVGSQAILAWSQGFLSMFSAEFALDVQEIQVFGDWAFERGTYRINLTPKSGDGSLKDVGKYITLYQRQPDGCWKVARDIWNSNNPPPQMG